MAYKYFDKKSAGSGVNMLTNKSAFDNEKLAEELQKPLIKKIKKERFIQDLKKIFGGLI